MDRLLGKALTGRLAARVACLIGALAIFAPAPAAAAGTDGHAAPQTGTKHHGRHRHGRRHGRRHLRAHLSQQRGGAVGVARNVAVGEQPSADASATDFLEAGCNGSLAGWNTAGVGESIPTIAEGVALSGSGSCRMTVTGSEDRSELIFGGNGGGSTAGMVEFHEGDEYFYSFSFYIVSMVYGHPGAHNLIMQFKGNDEGSPYFALGLWDYAGDDGHSGGRGLWTEGEAMGGNRFLAPVSEQQWHDVVVHFRASASGNGFYEVFLDGSLVDARGDVSMIPSAASYAYIKNGIYRNGSAIPGTSEILLDAAKLGKTWESVQPD